MNEKERLAETLLRCGLDLRVDQVLYLSLPVELFDFGRIVARVAYRMKAKFVHIEYFDPQVDDHHLNESDFDVLTHVAHLRSRTQVGFAQDKAAFLRIRDGGVYQIDADKARKEQYNKIINESLFPFRTFSQGNEISVCSTVLPTQNWANHVFPELSDEDALNALWQKIFSITHSDRKNGIGFWMKHRQEIVGRRNYLNQRRIVSMEFKSQHCHLTLRLPTNHIWVGGVEQTKSGQLCMPNFPTEEIFTAPLRNSLNGWIRNTRPLLYQNEKIDSFQLRFEEGVASVDYCHVNPEGLMNCLAFDEGAKYCGEIALLPGETLVSQSQTVFNNTLLDENAGCHLAIGNSYPCNLDPYKGISFDDVNHSKQHIDITFGSKDIHVTAIDSDGNPFEIIHDGKFKI